MGFWESRAEIPQKQSNNNNNCSNNSCNNSNKNVKEIWFDVVEWGLTCQKMQMAALDGH